MLPAHLTETLNNLGDAARALTDEVRYDKEQRAVEAAAQRNEQNRHNRRILALLVAVAVLVAGLVTISVLNRKLGVANAKLNRQNSQIVEQIKSCTTVGGECYEEQSKRTAEVADALLSANIAVAVCSRQETTEAAIRRCVESRLPQPGEKGDPAPVPGPAAPAPATPAPVVPSSAP